MLAIIMKQFVQAALRRKVGSKMSQQLIAYKRGYFDRGLEIERLTKELAEKDALIKKLEKQVPKKTKEEK